MTDDERVEMVARAIQTMGGRGMPTRSVDGGKTWREVLDPWSVKCARAALAALDAAGLVIVPREPSEARLIGGDDE